MCDMGRVPQHPQVLQVSPGQGLLGISPSQLPLGPRVLPAMGCGGRAGDGLKEERTDSSKEHKTEGIAMGPGNFPELSGLCSHRSMYLHLQEELHAFTHTLCCI